ncbi:MAG: hypothetical protein HYV08_10280 [Deltaproteobacteria bacterium]|nr:hypothetical protein [Deltaproteobacteria bacterium]MBI3077524.1 hypothetical protein [Deltaproteobacteria bacterium]
MRRPGSTARPRRRHALHALLVLLALGLPHPGVEAASFHRDQLIFLGRYDTFLGAYRIVIPVVFQRQAWADGSRVDFEYKAWAAWNGRWEPVLYETGALRADPADLNALVAEYVRARRGSDREIAVQRTADHAFMLRYRAPRTEFTLTTGPIPLSVTDDDPQGAHAYGVGEATAALNGRTVRGRVLYEQLPRRGARALDQSGVRLGQSDFMVLALEGGPVLLVNHARQARGFMLAALLGDGGRRAGDAAVQWGEARPDPLTGRPVPQRWALRSPGLGLAGELREWGRNITRGSGAGPGAPLYGMFMVRGEVRVQGRPHPAFGLNAHVQD